MTSDRSPGRLALIAILLAAAWLRSDQIGRDSFWYDEVVTIRLARQDGPSGLIRLLDRIDATRAPLHPLALQGWIGLFGPSEAAARSLSAACGVATVAAAGLIGSRAFGRSTGLWAAALAAASPLLVEYSREARMYALLTLLTCLAWSTLLGFRREAGTSSKVIFAATLVALAYAHPLGLLMDATLGLAYLATSRGSKLRVRPWLAIQAVAAAAIAPWVGRYLDHPPEFLTGPLPIRFLLGLPIGFIGGDSRALLGCLALIAIGMVRREGRRPRPDCPAEAVALLIWFLIPPAILYAYARLGHPVFGPARYTLFVGPAYLILVARGLARLPRGAALPAAAVLGWLMWGQLGETVLRPGLKADWRGAAEVLQEHPGRDVAVVLSDSDRNVEVETARYFLRPPDRAVAWPPGEARLTPPAWLAVGLRRGRPVAAIPAAVGGLVPGKARDLPGLRLIELVEPGR